MGLRKAHSFVGVLEVLVAYCAGELTSWRWIWLKMLQTTIKLMHRSSYRFINTLQAWVLNNAEVRRACLALSAPNCPGRRCFSRLSSQAERPGPSLQGTGTELTNRC